MKIIKIVLISIFVLSILIFIDSKINVVNTGGSTYPSNWNVKSNLKRFYTGINQALNMIKQNYGTVCYNDKNEIAKQLIKKFLPMNNVKFVKNSTEFPYSEISDIDIFKYKLSEYKNSPILTDVSGISYILYKIENNCSIVDVDNYENSSCIIIVDTNGYKDKPNSIKYKPKNSIATDRYPFIIDGNTNSVVIPKYFEDLIKNN